MAKKKAVNYLNLKSFWGKAEAWITNNFKSLFENDEELEKMIKSLEDENKKLKGMIETLQKSDFA